MIYDTSHRVVYTVKGEKRYVVSVFEMIDYLNSHRDSKLTDK